MDFQLTYMVYYRMEMIRNDECEKIRKSLSLGMIMIMHFAYKQNIWNKTAKKHIRETVVGNYYASVMEKGAKKRENLKRSFYRFSFFT